MAGIVYLDIDDEITSAAARIRTMEDARIVLVLPAGSRLATSRINFRLLAREAQARSRQLSIVAPEGATRALAASAGLPAYGSVMEMEAALEEVEPVAEPVTLEESAATVRPKRKGSVAKDTEPTMVMPTPSKAATAGAVATGAGAGAGIGASVVPEGARRRGYPADLPVAPAGVGRSGGRRTWPIVVGALGAAILFVGAVGGYLLLPSASIVVTPRAEAIGPLTFTVTADSGASSPDAQTAMVPAVVQTFPLTASGSFPATGTKVTETKANGTVTFTSRNTAEAVTIAAGTQVSTSSGIVFVTTRAVTVPKAVFLPPTPGTADVPVLAVVKGTSGNVPTGSITQTSTRVQAQLVNSVDPVNNAQPTSGGKHTEILVVAQPDVDKATTVLRKQLATQLDAILAAPAQVLPEVTVFPETKAISVPTPDPDPATLVGQQVSTFSLGLSANGSVMSVDESAVRAVADQRLRGSVKSDSDLVPGSTNIKVGAGRVSGASIAFAVTATGSQVRRLDASELKSEVKGHTADEARVILTQYGDVTIDLWPAWATTIPSLDFRLSLAIHSSVPPASPGVGASPAPSASLPELTAPSTEPSATP